MNNKKIKIKKKINQGLERNSVVQHLPSMYKALGLISSTTYTKKLNYRNVGSWRKVDACLP
jgi:hypothetical protein